MKTKDRIFVIIAAALVAACVFMYTVILGLKSNLSAAESVVEDGKQKIEYYKNDLGLEVAKRVAVEVNLKQAREYYEEYIREIQAQHRVKVRELEVALKAATSVTIPGSGDVIIIEKDTCIAGQEIPSALSFSSMSEWMDLSGKVYIKDLRVDYEVTVRDSVSFIMYRKRRGFMRTGREELFVEGTSKNPFTTVSGLQGLKIGENRRRPFGVGFSAGYAISGTGLSPYIGVGLNYSIIRF